MNIRTLGALAVAGLLTGCGEYRAVKSSSLQQISQSSIGGQSAGPGSAPSASSTPAPSPSQVSQYPLNSNLKARSLYFFKRDLNEFKIDLKQYNVLSAGQTIQIEIGSNATKYMDSGDGVLTVKASTATYMDTTSVKYRIVDNNQKSKSAEVVLAIDTSMASTTVLGATYLNQVVADGGKIDVGYIQTSADWKTLGLGVRNGAGSHKYTIKSACMPGNQNLKFDWDLAKSTAMKISAPATLKGYVQSECSFDVSITGITSRVPNLTYDAIINGQYTFRFQLGISLNENPKLNLGAITVPVDLVSFKNPSSGAVAGNANRFDDIVRALNEAVVKDGVALFTFTKGQYSIMENSQYNVSDTRELAMLYRPGGEKRLTVYLVNSYPGSVLGSATPNQSLLNGMSIFMVADQIERLEVMVHEFGHSVNLGHSADFSSQRTYQPLGDYEQGVCMMNPSYTTYNVNSASSDAAKNAMSYHDRQERTFFNSESYGEPMSQLIKCWKAMQ